MDGPPPDIRFLEHPTLGIVALRADINSQDVEAFISWIRRVLTPVAEANAWNNLPRTLGSHSPMAQALLDACAPAGYGGGPRGKRLGPSKCFICGQTGHRSHSCPQSNGPYGGADNDYGGSRRSSNRMSSGGYNSGGYGYNSGGYGGGLGKDPGPSAPPMQPTSSSSGYDTGGYGARQAAAEEPRSATPARPPTAADTDNAEPGDANAASKDDTWLPHVIKKEARNFYDLSSGDEEGGS